MHTIISKSIHGERFQGTAFVFKQIVDIKWYRILDIIYDWRKALLNIVLEFLLDFCLRHKMSFLSEW